MDAPAPGASTDVLGWCTVCCNKEQTTKEHICVGPIFVLFHPFSYVRAANLVLHKLPDPPVSFPFQQRDRFLTDVCTGLPPFSLFDQQSGWIASLYYFPSLLSSLNHVLDSCSTPPHPSFLFEPRPRFDYRIEKDPHVARAMAVSKKLIP